LNEVKAIGRPQQRDANGRPDRRGHLLDSADVSAVERGSARAAIKKDGSVLDNARLFALLTTAGADSLFACWVEKNKWHHWRPITAIRGAAAAHNAALQADPNWEPLLGTPAHQEYPSGHSCLAGPLKWSSRPISAATTLMSRNLAACCGRDPQLHPVLATGRRK